MAVLISRDAMGSIGGVPETGRVYVVGPLWNVDERQFATASYSSTRNRAEASRFSREVAEAMLAHGKWRTHRPEIEEA